MQKATVKNHCIRSSAFMKPAVFFIFMSIMPLLPGCMFKDAPVQNYKTFIYWSQRNAEKGSVSAQKMLGAMYYLGEGVPKNLKKAYTWYRLAANQGDPSAQKFLNIITALLPEDQFNEAQALFLSEHNKIQRLK